MWIRRNGAWKKVDLYKRIAGAWVKDEGFVHKLAPLPATEPLPPPLPLCACGNEVKAGEDQCWVCLGERVEELDPKTFYSEILLARLVPALQNANQPIPTTP